MGGAASHHENELVLDVLRLEEPAFAVNGAHQIVAWNDGAERLLGLRANDVIGMRCYEALAIGDSGLCATCHIASRASARANAAPPHAQRRATVHPRDPLAQSERRRIALTTIAAHTRAGQVRFVHLLQDASVDEVAFIEADATQSGPHHQRRSSALASATAQPPLQPSFEAASGARAGEPSESVTRQRRPEMLTHRELEVLRLLGAGHSTNDIARELSITRVTARNHVNKVLDKLGVNSRLQAVVIASQLQLI